MPSGKWFYATGREKKNRIIEEIKKIWSDLFCQESVLSVSIPVKPEYKKHENDCCYTFQKNPCAGFSV
jgi:hypothetical protein